MKKHAEVGLLYFENLYNCARTPNLASGGGKKICFTIKACWETLFVKKWHEL